MAHRPDRGRYRLLLLEQDDDPLSGLANLFDVAMVFAVAILLVLFSRAPMLRDLSAREPHQPEGREGEAISRESRLLTRYRESESEASGRGERLGVAYRLESGEVVYVPSQRDPL